MAAARSSAATVRTVMPFACWTSSGKSTEVNSPSAMSAMLPGGSDEAIMPTNTDT